MARGPDGAELERTLAEVGARLRRLRHEREMTLAELSAGTGISASTLSRLESGQRRATLELLLPLARIYQVPLDDLVGAPCASDPRVHGKPITRGNITILPLSHRPGGIQTFKHIIAAGPRTEDPDPRSHDGYDWLFVLNGRLRIVLGEHDFVLTAGEAAEFDTRVPHWFGGADEHSVEFLSIFGAQGQRVHLRARSRPSTGAV
ncbi:Transcriptional regulator, XRE family with cupin sensor [Frankia canadensis]|uniref:Transcriptional regulator, XRE family with cupin sensor n=1 Tax=Frankia canadensis TaxID=1836972 RepID=A0A2I2KIK7_9ACTN|nr:XRE family transcriptional regulator [Frankia canadensis]SNQ45496.1 Transcriptional regulator, XRE family with cupin sensor [Frankia canadensis]SOU52786.1 Transcriptional regulator, XRE family with cupin sensor [Frankia canadensis]